VIGANTPAMIRSMTREVESRNLIAASMLHACKALTCRRPASRSRADSFSHYTFNGMTRNICLLATPRLLATFVIAEESAAATSPDALPGYFKATRPDLCGVLRNCHKL
jgi:hypothetical protein